MTITVQIKGTNNTIDFPDGTPVDEINNAMERFISSRSIDQPESSSFDRIKNNSVLKSFEEIPNQLSYGAMDTLSSIGDLLGQETPILREIAKEKPQTVVGSASRVVGQFVGDKALVPGLRGVGMAANLSNSPVVAQKIAKTKEWLKPASEAIGKGVSEVASALSSVPSEFIVRAFTKEAVGQSIFKGKFRPERFRELGNRATASIQYLRNLAGKEVKNETTALRNTDNSMDVRKYISQLDDMVANNEVGRMGSSLTKVDIKLINNVKSDLLKFDKTPMAELSEYRGAKPIELHGIKKKIDNLVIYKKETLGAPSPGGQAILKDMRDSINKDLRSISDSYATANDKFSRIAEIQKNVAPKLKEANLQRNMQNIFSSEDPFIRNSLKEIDEIVPNNMKFFEETADLAARSPFESLVPKGGAYGAGNMFRLLATGLSSGTSAPIFSPLVHKQAIKYSGPIVGRTASSAKYLIPRAAVIASGQE